MCFAVYIMTTNIYYMLCWDLRAINLLKKKNPHNLCNDELYCLTLKQWISITNIVPIMGYGT